MKFLERNEGQESQRLGNTLFSYICPKFSSCTWEDQGLRENKINLKNENAHDNYKQMQIEKSRRFLLQTNFSTTSQQGMLINHKVSR